MTTFSDDEQVFESQSDVAGLENEYTVGKAKIKIINADNTPLEETKLRVLLEVTGNGQAKERFGVDLVIVLDISDSMNQEDRLEKLKKAAEFVIKTLSPIDRVSIVTFSDVATRLCAFRQIKKESQVDILNLVNGLVPGDHGANISDGLEVALQVISGRKYTEGRVVGIVLMSSGEQNRGGNAAQVKVENVPVYTFGFGTSVNDPLTTPHVLEAIARNSCGGTFSDVQSTNDFSVAFARCFGGLLTVAVKDFKLIIAPENRSIIEKVYADDYEQCRDDSTIVSVMFGNLYENERRQVIVDLLLPPVNGEISTQVLKASYRYSNKQGTKELKSPPLFATTKRIGNVTEEEEVMVEVSRIKIASTMTEARAMACNNNDRRPYVLSTELLHERQRHAARGDTGEQVLFSTPRMEAYKKQAMSLDEGHVNSLPTDEDNVKEL